MRARQLRKNVYVPRARSASGRLFLPGALAVLLTCNGASATGLLSIDWQRQVGTVSNDIGHDISVDSAGNSYIAGETSGGLNGETNNGGRDAFQFSLDASGADRWTRLSGTAQDDVGLGNTALPTGENYLTGWTREDLSGTYHGENDIFLHGFLTGGGAFSGHQWGTSSFDSGQGVGIDAAGNRYVAGQTSGDLNGEIGNSTSQAFLLKQNDSGVLQWTRLLGTTGSELAADVAVDAGGAATITGFTSGSLVGSNAGLNDVFAVQYDTSGGIQWMNQIGSDGSDNAWAVGIDPAGNVYVAGDAGGSIDGQTFSGGFSDAFVAKFDVGGALVWARLLGDTGDDTAQGIAVDSLGNSYIVGWTNGDIGGPNQGLTDTFLAKYDTDGNLKWTHQLGTGNRDEAEGIALLNGYIYITGTAFSSFTGSYQGGRDVFVIRFAETAIPEPSSCVLTMLAVALCATVRRRCSGRPRRD